MALGAATQWKIISGSTANNVNGGGFNTANANFLTDFTTDTNTGNTSAPVISSASYNFVAGDVGALFYVKSGTSWTAGFYPIASVASNKATLNAAIGAAYQLSATYGKYILNIVVGCATVGTPTSGTCGVDYSSLTTAPISAVADFNAIGASSTLTSATAAFRRVMVGNIFHQTTTGTGAFGIVGWYEIANYTNATTVVLDRTPNSGTASVNTTGYVGGAMSLNSTLDDDFYEVQIAGNINWYKGSLTLGEAVAIAASGSNTAPIEHIGYNTVPGDNPTPFGATSNAPVLDTAALGFTFGTMHNYSYLIITGTVTPTVIQGSQTTNRYFKALNTSTSANRNALSLGGNSQSWNFEAVSQKGIAVITTAASNGRAADFYAHDSGTGYNNVQQGVSLNRGLFAHNLGGILVAVTGSTIIDHCTIHGFTGTPPAATIGISIGNNDNPVMINNCIIDGYETAIAQTTAANPSSKGQYNAYFNYTTAATLYAIDTTDLLATDPQYVGAAELSGTGATSTGSTVTFTGSPDLTNVTDNVDYIRVVSATTAVVMTYLVTGHNNGAHTVTTSPAIGTGTNIVWILPTGHNFQIGNNLKGAAFPGTYEGSTSISYQNQGAIKRAVNNGTAGGSYGFS